jgi:hypothetical protein
MNNNIDNLIFDNHDTYVYFSKPILASEHRVNLPAVFNDDDIVYYSSYVEDLQNNGLVVGTFKPNRFTRNEVSESKIIVTFIGTIVINDKGTLVFNYASEIETGTNLYVVGQSFNAFATYKGGFYSKYLNVKISIDASNNDYRVVTISY